MSVEIGFEPRDLADAMRETYGELIEFVNTPAFRNVYAELMALPPHERPRYVSRVLLDTEELRKRGVELPPEILIQVSAFGDRRPTLFAVKKYLASKFHAIWENVNLTFDNRFEDNEVSRDPSVAWRPPLPIALQNALLEANIDLNALPDSFAVEGVRLFSPPPGIDGRVSAKDADQ
jgi:hypothetical protein